MGGGCSAQPQVVGGGDVRAGGAGFRCILHICFRACELFSAVSGVFGMDSAFLGYGGGVAACGGGGGTRTADGTDAKSIRRREWLMSMGARREWPMSMGALSNMQSNNANATDRLHFIISIIQSSNRLNHSIVFISIIQSFNRLSISPILESPPIRHLHRAHQTTSPAQPTCPTSSPSSSPHPPPPPCPSTAAAAAAPPPQLTTSPPCRSRACPRCCCCWSRSP